MASVILKYKHLLLSGSANTINWKIHKLEDILEYLWIFFFYRNTCVNQTIPFGICISSQNLQQQHGRNEIAFLYKIGKGQISSQFFFAIFPSLADFPLLPVWCKCKQSFCDSKWDKISLTESCTAVHAQQWFCPCALYPKC